MRIEIAPEDLHEGKKGKPDSGPSNHPIAVRPTTASPLGGIHFQQLLQNIYDAVLVVDRNGEILASNVRASQFFLAEPEQLRRYSVLTLICGADESLLPTVLETLKGNRYVLMQAYCRRMDGTRFPAEISVNQIMLDGRNLLSFFVRDVTFRKQAEETRALLASVVESTDDAILTTNLDGKITSWNRGAERLFGYSQADAIGQPITMLIPEDLLSEEQSIVEKLKQGENTDHYETRRLRKAGTLCEVSLSVSPLKDSEGNIIGASKIVRDITERKLAEREIRKLNEELEQRVIDRTAQLEAALKELDAFSYSVSHDLRAPLRAIDGYSRMLEEDYGTSLACEGVRMLKVVRSETNRMGHLIDDLLAFCRLGRQKVTQEDIDMTLLAKSVFTEIQTRESERKVEFKLGQLCNARGEPAMLRQVWINLLSNAVKFTKHREIAIVEAGCRNEGAETIYYVKDNGAGFDMAYAKKLFGVFQRLHGESEFEGTGVGLALVQRIVSRHGGRVWGEGKVDDGATFYFTLPNSRK